MGTDKSKASTFGKDLVRYELSQGVASITLDRPDKLNAFNARMIADLSRCFELFERDETAHVAILSGTGRAFSAGVDYREEHELSEEEMRRLRDPMAPGTLFGDLLTRSGTCKPVIAAVHGYALGMALGLMLKCDLIVAEAGTRFQVSEVSRGLGGFRHWALLAYRNAGALAAEVSLNGRYFTAEECHAAGLLTRLVAEGKARDTALELGRELAGLPPLGVRETVRVQRWHLARFIDEVAFQTEPLKLHLTEDFKDATRAFAEKRNPGPYKGR